MKENQPRLFGLNHSNRDFTNKKTWGKNQFNSSFPTALAIFLSSKQLNNVYLRLNSDLEVVHSEIATTELFGVDNLVDDVFYAFESLYPPYEQLVIEPLPRVDLVTQNRALGKPLKPLEIKLTALPDHTTCNLSDNKFGSELVIRPDTIVYLACSIAKEHQHHRQQLRAFFPKELDLLKDSEWSNGEIVWQHLPLIIETLDKVLLSMVDKQSPIIMQPIWKTQGKSPALAENCLDVFIWSNLAFTQLFLNASRITNTENGRITRQIRTTIWLFKMLYDFASSGKFNHKKIIDELSYNTKNDKAFAMNGTVTQPYMDCPELHYPRIGKTDIQNIILGGGQNLLSPERRFDAIIFNSPELFQNEK